MNWPQIIIVMWNWNKGFESLLRDKLLKWLSDSQITQKCIANVQAINEKFEEEKNNNEIVLKYLEEGAGETIITKLTA